jgi:RNA polymerase sigma-70 factor (ECF subfamily)
MTTADLPEQIHAQRGYLLRIARLQLRDREVAEDVVQDTLVAALEGASRFSGKSSVKTWLVGILKHKIVDAIRQRMREPVMSTLAEDADLEPCEDFFDQTGHWASRPAEWGDATASLEQKEFLGVMDFCLEKLPPNQGRAFMLREVFELDAEEICKTLSVTSTNLWVLLYRARLALRQCLEQNWFGPAGHKS